MFADFSAVLEAVALYFVRISWKKMFTKNILIIFAMNKLLRFAKMHENRKIRF